MLVQTVYRTRGGALNILKCVAYTFVHVAFFLSVLIGPAESRFYWRWIFTKKWEIEYEMNSTSGPMHANGRLNFFLLAVYAHSKDSVAFDFSYIFFVFYFVNTLMSNETESKN